MRVEGVVGLGLCILVTGLGTVWSRHESRQLFLELQALEQQSAALHEQWQRLQIERSTWAAHHRIEAIARRDLDMRVPNEEMLVVVEPDG